MPRPGFKGGNRRSRKRCYFTENKINYIDFKEYEMLRRFTVA